MVYGGQKLNTGKIVRLNKIIQRGEHFFFSSVSKKIRKDAETPIGEVLKAALRKPTTDRNGIDLDGAQLSHTPAI